MSYLLAFLLAASWNAAWSRYACAIHAKQAWRCAGWAALMSAVGGAQVLIYTASHYALVAQVIGAACGAWIGARRAS